MANNSELAEIHSFQFHEHATDYLAAAEIVAKDDRRLLLPAYFLVCQSIELGLKAFLRLKQVSTQTLKKGVGHNLKKALEQAIATGLAPSDPHFSAVVTELSELYDGKQFQYFNRDTITMPGLDTCCRVTKTFLDDIRQSCDQERIAFLRTRFPPK